MTKNADAWDPGQLAELESLRKTCEALMRRVEGECATPRSAYAAFERNVHTQKLVEQCTADLRENAARLLEENRKQARTKALLNEAQRIAKVGGWMFDLQTGTLETTQQFMCILELGYDCTVTIDKLLQYYEDEFRTRVRAAWSEAINGGRPFEIEGGAITAKGSRIQLRMHCQVYSEDGRAARLLGLINDVTEMRLTEARMAQSQRLESIGQLAAGIAHEINTPVQFVGDNIRFLESAFSEVLRALDEIRTATADGPAEVAAKIDEALARADYGFLKREIPAAIAQGTEGLERVAKLVRSMKDFAHPGSDHAELADLNRAITSTVNVARNEWKYVADVDLQLAPDLPPVPCFLADLNQVLLNMIVNSAHAIDERQQRTGSKDKGRIRISTRVEAEWAVIDIDDDGCGISQDVIGRIFDPFFTTKPVGKGTGQGLAISHNVVVKRHRGKIDVASQVGVGTKMTLRLPLAAEPSVEACPAS